MNIDEQPCIWKINVYIYQFDYGSVQWVTMYWIIYFDWQVSLALSNICPLRSISNPLVANWFNTYYVFPLHLVNTGYVSKIISFDKNMC